MLDTHGKQAKVLGVADARIDTAKGGLICRSVDKATLDPGNSVTAAGTFRNYDRLFYYFELGANAANRIRRYLAAIRYVFKKRPAFAGATFLGRSSMVKVARIGFALVLLAGLLTSTVGCSGAAQGPDTASSNSPTAGVKPSDSVPQTDAQGAPNYANAANWLAVPSENTKSVDVFYLGDTTYSKPDSSSPDVGPIDDANMKQGAQVKFTTTGSVFEPIANVYAPYNRQLDAQFKSTLPISQQLQLEAEIPTADAISAFEYYLENLNEGRPFILAGHSQGSNLIANILAGYMKEHPELYERMIAAYVIGFSVTGDYLTDNPQLKFAQGPDDTGVIISYNTEAPVMLAANPVTMPGGVAINPITWTTSETTAAASQSLGGIAVDPETGGAVIDDAGNLVKTEHYADGTVNQERGVVICSTADPNQLAPGNSALQAGIYHGFDYPLYYFDIQANASNRIQRYLANR